MVLHLRKLIAVFSALIVMMGAMPAFAAEEEMPATTEEIQVEEAAPEEVKETAVTEEAEKTCEPAAEEKAVQPEEESNVQQAEKPETAEKPDAQEEAVIVYLTFTDEEDVTLIDEENFETAEGTSLKVFLETVMEDMDRECQWDLYSIECNEETVNSHEPEKYILRSGDKLVISYDADKKEKADGTDESHSFSMQASESDISSSSHEAIRKTGDIMNSSDWAWGSEWGIIGLSRLSDVNSGCADRYCSSLATYLKEIRSDRLSQTKSSDNARTVLALTALGYDPTDVNGYDLLAPLADFDYVAKPYLSGPVWTLIAIDSHSYDLPEAGKGRTQTTRELLIDTILKEQKGAGWSFSGGAPEVDMTCMVIQSLAPYYGKENTRVNAAVDKAVNWLSNVQNKNGGYTSFGNESSESASQVITALTAVGIDPNTDPRFIKNGKSVVDSLLGFRTKDGGFKHLAEDKKYNTLATYQGCYALTAYVRFIEGRTSLYDMNDVTLNKFTAKPNSSAGNDSDDPQDTDKDDKDKKDQQETEPGGASLTLGKTFSLGGMTISLGAAAGETDLDAEAAGKSGLASEGYDTIAEKNRLMNTLPWIYGGIAALAALALIIVLRNRKPE